MMLGKEIEAKKDIASKEVRGKRNLMTDHRGHE